MFNKSYHTRASRRGELRSVGQILEELAERAGDRQGFYRPQRRLRLGAAAKKRSGKLRGVQLELFGNDGQPVSSEVKATALADRPLFDLLPEAYQWRESRAGRALAQSDQGP